MIHNSKVDCRAYDISISKPFEEINKSDDIICIWDNNDGLVTLVGWYFGDYDYETTESYIYKYMGTTETVGGDIIKDDLVKEYKDKAIKKVPIGEVYWELQKYWKQFDEGNGENDVYNTPIYIGIGNKLATLYWGAPEVQGLQEYFDSWLISEEVIELMVEKDECYHSGSGIWISNILFEYGNKHLVMTVTTDDVDIWTVYQNIPKENGQYDSVHYDELIEYTGDGSTLNDDFKKYYYKALKLLAARKEV